MRISDWSSDVCSSDLWSCQLAPENSLRRLTIQRASAFTAKVTTKRMRPVAMSTLMLKPYASGKVSAMLAGIVLGFSEVNSRTVMMPVAERTMATDSEEHTSELQSLMRISYAVFCLKKKRHTVKT